MSFKDFLDYLYSAPIREVFKICFIVSFVFVGVQTLIRFIYDDPDKTFVDLVYDLLKGDSEDNGVQNDR